MSRFDLSTLSGQILTCLLLVPYFGWGIYTLRLRYRYRHELSATAEVATLAAVVLFNVLEMSLLRKFVGPMSLYYIFALLGLVVSGAALYGAVFVSVLSRLLVDLVFPPEPSKTREPRYAPAEALEREGDYEGALREYIMIARIFPREPGAFLRSADICVQLDRPEETAAWLERAVPLLKDEEACLAAVNRLAEIHHRRLGRADDAARALTRFLERFPDGDFAASVRARRDRILAADSRETQPIMDPPPSLQF